MRLVRDRLVVTALVLLISAAIACGSDPGSTNSIASTRSAPEYNFTGVGVAPEGALEISNASRAGQVTILYFSFVG